jgi:flagellar biosynthesis GTPase FlhF
MASINSRGVVIDDGVPIPGALFDHRDKPGLSHRVAYYNHTGQSVTIVDRRGVACRLQTNSGRRAGLNRSLYIAITYDDIDGGTDVILDRPDISDSDPNRVAFVSAFESRNASPMAYRSQTRSSTVLYEIPGDTIRQNQALYYRNLDIVVTFLSDPVHHPYERAGALHNELMQTPNLEVADEFVLGLRIVDNNGRIGPRYVNINGRVYRVPASRRPDLPDGVHVKCNNRALGDVGLPPPATLEHYTIDAYDTACKDDLTLLRLFTSIDLARNLGDMQTARKEELERVQFERKKQEEEFRQQKLTDDRENARLKRVVEESDRRHEEDNRRWQRRNDELEQQKKDLEHQIKMQELESKRRLEELKHETAMQKMNKDNENQATDNLASMFKSIATVIGGIGVILVAYEKLKKD